MHEIEEDLTEKKLKIVLVGDSGVGKTSIALKFCNDEFSRQYNPTSGLDFLKKNLSLGPYKNVTLHIWDVGGLALHGTMLDKYIYKAELIMLIYDVTNSSSFDVLEQWLDTIENIINNENYNENKKPLMVIVGNKCDMEHQRSVKREKSHRLAAEKNLIYNDMSARTGESVSLCIANLAAKVLGVQLTQMDQDFCKPIVTAEIGDSVDMMSVQRPIKRQPNKKTCPNDYPIITTLPKSSAVCILQ